MARRLANDGGVRTMPAPKTAEPQPAEKSERFKDGLAQHAFPHQYANAARWLEKNIYPQKTELNMLEVGIGRNGAGPWLLAHSLRNNGKKGGVVGIDIDSECIKTTLEAPRLDLFDLIWSTGMSDGNSKWIGEFVRKNGGKTLEKLGGRLDEDAWRDAFGTDAAVMQPDTKALEGLVRLERASIFEYEPKEKFDAAVCVTLMMHFDQPERVKLLSSMAKALKPGGTLIVDGLPGGQKFADLAELEAKFDASKYGLEAVAVVTPQEGEHSHTLYVFKKR